MADTNILQFRDQANNDASVYPITLIEAIMDSSTGSAQNLPKYLTEYNVSVHNNNAKYTLQNAINKVPSAYQKGGMKICFNDANGVPRTYILDSSVWSSDVKKWYRDDSQTMYFTNTQVASEAHRTVGDASTGFHKIAGNAVKIKFTNAYSGSSAVTLEIGGTGSSPLYYDGAAVTSSNTWEAGETVDVYWDGTNYMANNVSGGGKFKNGQKVRETNLVPDSSVALISPHDTSIFNAGAIAQLINEYNISVHQTNTATGDRQGSNIFTLEEAIAQVPAAYRHGGLKLTFNSDSSVTSCYRLMTTNFSNNVSDWQGIVDTIPLHGDKNLISSGGVAKITYTDKIIEQPTDYTNYINSSNIWHEKTVSAYGILIPISPNKTYKINTTDTSNIVVALLSSNSTIPGETPDFCENYPERFIVYSGDEFGFIAPSDAQYIYFTKHTSQGERIFTFSELSPVNETVDYIQKKITLDLSVLLAVSDTLATFTDLSSAINAIPNESQVAGMSIQYIDSNFNKYVKYRHIKPIWSSNIEDWVEDDGLFINSSNLTINVALDKYIVDYAITQEGKFGTNVNSKHLCIPVTQGETYIISPIAEHYTNYAFVISDLYASGKNVPLLAGTSVLTLYNASIINIPNGCSYLLVYNSANSRPFLVYRYDIDILTERCVDDKISDTVSDMRTVITEKSNSTYLTGFYTNLDTSVSLSNGVYSVIQTGTPSYLSIRYIQVKKDDLVYIKMKPGGYDTTMFVGTFSNRPEIGSQTEYGKLIKLSDGVTHAFCYKAPIDGWFLVSYDDSTTTGINRIDLVKYATFIDDIHTYVEEEVPLEITTGKIIDIATWNEDDNHNSTFGKEITASSITTYGITDYIDITQSKYIRVGRFVTKAYAVRTFVRNNPYQLGSCFYDSNKEPIQAIHNATVVNGSYPDNGHNGDMYVEVPDGAKYIRVFSYNSSDYNIAILKTKLSKFVIENDKDDFTTILNIINQAKYVGTTGTPNLNLLHFSDFHEDGDAGNILMRYYSYFKDSIDDVISTGDVVMRYLSNGSPLTYFNVPGLAQKALFTLGNHDQVYDAATRYEYFWANAGTNGDGVIDTTAPKYEVVLATHTFSYNRYFKDFIDGWGVTMPTGYDDPTSPYYQACYWHKDYTSQKVRLIGIDCMYKFDGILSKDNSGDFIKDNNGMLTIATGGEGMAKLTTEQETWLYNLLMDTVDSSSAAYGYSVIVTTHYPLDNVDGQCTIVNKENTGDGTVVDYRTGDNVRFNQSIEESSFTLSDAFNMRNRVPTSTTPYYTQGNVNNIGDIIKHFIDSNGKFVAYLCGHTHKDWFYYPKNYSDILCVVIDQAGNLRDQDENARPNDTDARLCANFYSIDTTNHLFKIVRFGLTQGKNLREKRYLCYDYVNKKVISEG